MKKVKGPEALVVTTAHKGVFFGYGQSTDKDTIELKKCRMCVYWPADVRGVLGLAVTGPLKGSRITPAVSSIILREITSVMKASDEAIKNWEIGLWQ